MSELKLNLGAQKFFPERKPDTPKTIRYGYSVKFLSHDEQILAEKAHKFRKFPIFWLDSTSICPLKANPYFPSKRKISITAPKCSRFWLNSAACGVFTKA